MSSADPGQGGIRAAPALTKTASASESEKKRANPLGELITTEVRYVAELSVIIRRVAGAWNPSNFPPPELDAMFRAIEVVYRTNNEFLHQLHEIGPNPTSPKGLGNLLMQWIDKLHTPYKQYCHTFYTGLDQWQPIVRNKELSQILAQVSNDIPRPAQGASSPPWTLDALFGLPIARLRFYKKLYSRLLRSTQPGRSDHDLLRSANDKLDALLDIAQQRGSVGNSAPVPAVSAGPAVATAPIAKAPPVAAPPAATAPSPAAKDAAAPATHAAPAIGLGAPLAGGAPLALNAVPAPAPAPASTPAPAAATANPRGVLTQSLERQSMAEIQERINSAYTIDIFTMQPKSCRLQINPPTLPFRRSVRITDGVVMHIKPAADKDTRTVNAARLILLTDLVLIGEDVVTPPNQAPTKQDIWLMFPPLAGKFVDVQSYGAPNEHAIRVEIMKRAELLVYLPNEERKQAWIRELTACRQFGMQRTPSSQSKSPQRSASQSSAHTPQRSGSVSTAPPVPSPQAAQPVQAPPAAAQTQPRPLMQSLAPRSAPPPGPQSPMAGPMPGALPGALGGPSPLSSAPNAPPNAPPNALAPLSGAPGASTGAGGPTAAALPAPLAGMGAPVRPPPAPQGPGAVPPQSLGPLSQAASPPSALAPSIGMASRPGGRTNLPPLLLPTQAPSDILPGVPVAEQDSGLVSPPLNSAHLTRESSLNSIESFPRVAGRRMESPDGRGPSPLSPGSPSVSPTRTVFGKAAATPLNNEDRQRMVSSPLSQRMPPQPLGSQANAAPRRPSEPNLGLVGVKSPARSQSQPRLDGVGSAKPPSQMLLEGGRQSTPEWLHTDDAPRAATVQDGRRPSFNLCAQMRCKVFLKQSYAQWKSLGSARLRLYHLNPAGMNQLVVENDKKLIISTIVLPDAVERVGKTGLAVELSDSGRLTGVVYMLHMRSEESATGLFQQLLEGSSRTTLPSPVAP